MGFDQFTKPAPAASGGTVREDSRGQLGNYTKENDKEAIIPLNKPYSGHRWTLYLMSDKNLLPCGHCQTPTHGLCDMEIPECLSCFLKYR